MKTYASGDLIANRYEVASRPMMGGMGIVYICLDRQEDRPVALKTFKPEYLPDRATRDRFLREGTHWVDLGVHPNVVRCYQVVRTDNGLEVYLVLELIAKEQGYPDASLRSWLFPGQPLPLATALLFALQITRGMQHAVSQLPGFVHRDLKPENILVGADKLPGTFVNRLRVTDFGLAAVLQEARSLRQDAGSSGRMMNVTQQPVSRTQLTHGIVGTPLYMAPEQWLGEPVGVYTDVYALGCALVEMLTGHRAVVGDSPAALQRAHCAGEVRSVSSELPMAVQTLVARCVAREPGARYVTWDGLAEALMQVCERITGQPVQGDSSPTVLNRGECIAAGWSYTVIGASYLDISKIAAATECFKRAVEIGQVEQERRLVGAGLNGLGLSHRESGNLRLAVEEIEQSLHMAHEINDKAGEKAALGNLGTCYRQLGKVEDALACHQQCLNIAREINDQAGEGGALSALGLLHEETGQLYVAIDYHKQHLDLARRAGDQLGDNGALINLGICYFLMGQTTEAMTYQRSALDIARKIGDLQGEGRALASLGQCYLKTDLEKAKGFLIRSLSIAREIGDRQSVAAALGVLAMCQYRLRKWDEAEHMWRESLKISDEIGMIRTSGGACTMLAMLMVQQQRFSEALPLAERAAHIITRIGPPQHTQQAGQLVAHIRIELQKSSRSNKANGR